MDNGCSYYFLASSIELLAKTVFASSYLKLTLPPMFLKYFLIREFTQHDAPADDEPKKPRNERGHAILSQALARI